MIPTVVQLLPFALGGAFVPSWTSRVILFLGTDRPLANASAYVAGNATWRLAVGFASVFVATVAVPRSGGRGLALPVGLAWAVAAMLLATGVWLLVRTPSLKASRHAGLPAWMGALRRLPPWAAFGVGAYNCAMPGAQWVYFVGGCAVIASSGLELPERIALLVSFIALLEVMLATPIVIYARKRDEAQAVFARLNPWLSNHASGMFGGVLVVAATLFAYIALMGGQIGGLR